MSTIVRKRSSHGENTGSSPVGVTSGCNGLDVGGADQTENIVNTSFMDAPGARWIPVDEFFDQWAAAHTELGRCPPGCDIFPVFEVGVAGSWR
jgi:hypothetical protein